MTEWERVTIKGNLAAPGKWYLKRLSFNAQSYPRWMWWDGYQWGLVTLLLVGFQAAFKLAIHNLFVIACKINSKRITETSIFETTRGNQRRKCFKTLVWTVVFVHMITKAQATKAKIKKCNCSKSKSFCISKEMIIKMKRQLTRWKKIFANWIQQGINFQNMQGTQALQHQENNDLIEIRLNSLNICFSKEEIQKINKYINIFRITNLQINAYHSHHRLSKSSPQEDKKKQILCGSCGAEG